MPYRILHIADVHLDMAYIGSDVRLANRRRAQLQNRDRRQGEDGDLAADDADGLTRPQLEEVEMPPEAVTPEH